MTVSEIVVLLVVFSYVVADNPTVNVSSGTLVGRSVEFSHKDVDITRTLNVFKGIPYAAPPVGDLRFRPPQPVAPWGGVYNATEVGFACVQSTAPYYSFWERVNEDCLYLNVFAPVTNSSNLPVMVWIHGGALILGSGTNGGLYDGTVLAAIGEVIVVSFNYRLGVFGFFATGDKHAPGNYGLLDQIAALKWVKENIAAFGGDANKVTIFGESAGSTSVEHMLLSPMSEGLFHRAIMQSGTSSMFGGPHVDAEGQATLAYGIGNMFGCQQDNTEDLVRCLRTVPAKEFTPILNPEEGVLATIPGIDPDIAANPYAPYFDGQLITVLPSDLRNPGTIKKTGIDILIGANADEGTLFLAYLVPKQIKSSEVTLSRAVYEQYFSAFLFGSFKSNPTILDAIKLTYVPWEDADSDDANYAGAYSQMQGDHTFVCPSDLSARAYAQSGANVYVYHMTHVPATLMTGIPWMRAGHGEDIPFVFGLHFSPVRNWTMPADEVAMSRNIIRYWTNFAKTGNPNLPESEANSSLADWPRFEVPGLEYKELSLTMENKRALKARECALWNDFIPKVENRAEEETPNEEDNVQTSECTDGAVHTVKVTVYGICALLLLPSLLVMPVSPEYII
ncbi:acetylcholinesterase-like [Ptychodera flava]|uniref:acetylcholinesterase-like n=1 Tax=Ptychodera flava TaxID=63121 RepID=UPI00396A0BFC